MRPWTSHIKPPKPCLMSSAAWGHGEVSISESVAGEPVFCGVDDGGGGNDGDDDGGDDIWKIPTKHCLSSVA